MGDGAAMWWDRKTETIGRKKEQTEPASLATCVATPKWEIPMTDATFRPSAPVTSNNHASCLGGSLVLRGELSGKDDLVIEGQIEGPINLQDHCLTIAAQGQVKSDINARQVIISGSAAGKISAADRIEIRKTGHVVGDLIAAGIAIEEGAYFKGSIEVVRDKAREAPRAAVASRSAP
jgi:cytoskeletal protein CcmA (bactofilin family)